MNNKHISLKISVFHGKQAPEEGVLVGYGAIIEAYNLPVPIPNQLALISYKKRKYITKEWKVYTSRYQPEDTLYKQLIFALKYEGVNLLVFKKLFELVPPEEFENMIQSEILGQYSRKIWFLYEWLLNVKLNILDLDRGNPIPLIDKKLQYAIKGNSSTRHRIINNLPGTRDFCPLIAKTEKLEAYLEANLSDKKNSFLNTIHKDILQRASSFLILKDSKASFTIEGENPGNNRA
ncbi:MAG: cell filamentation protein Fic, partial [Flavobacteriaceae bacterium]|nr:cell filamentation protein Fic [Flavobacteriaceae bacterium]